MEQQQGGKEIAKKGSKMFPEHGTKQTTDSLDFLSATFVVKWIRARNLPTFPGTKLCTHMTQSGTCLSLPLFLYISFSAFAKIYD